jgi:endonuclease/exonuclease/phosphatase (EEP) superfamily protein YafD
LDAWLELFSFLFAILALAPVVRTPSWWVRIVDFPRAQVLALSLGCLALDLVFLDLAQALSWTALAALGSGLALELWRIVPYTFAHRIELRWAAKLAPNDQFSLLTCNVYQNNREPKRLLDVVDQREPDVILLLEVDAWWMEQLQPLRERYPHRLSRPQDDTYGMALFSRFNLIEPEIRFLRRKTIPSVQADIELPSGRKVRLYGLHPAPPVPEYAETTSQRDAELVHVGREARKFRGPTVVLGDLNDVAWSHTTRLFRRLSGLLDPRVGRRTMSTFPVAIPWMRFPLDHIFVSNHFELVELERLEDVGSDHFPVWARLQLDPAAEAEQPEPQPEGDDREEAREIVNEADVELVDENANEAGDRTRFPSPDPARVPQAFGSPG